MISSTTAGGAPTTGVKTETPDKGEKKLTLATEREKIELLANHEVFLFDIDGTLWKGGVLLDGVPELLKLLRYQGKTIFFVTNNATRTRTAVLEKLVGMGIAAKLEEIHTSAYAAAVYLKALWFKKKVYVIGEAGLVEELQGAGLTVLGGPADSAKAVDWSTPETSTVPTDPEIGAIVVALDRGFNYWKLQYATSVLVKNPACLFIATNTDPRAHLTATEEWADSGPLVAAIIGSTEREPVVVGKPSPIIIDAIRRTSGQPKAKMCIIGDRLETDIVWGLQNGCTTLLVLTGVTSEAMLLSDTNDIQPKLVINAVGDLLSIKDKLPFSSCSLQ